MFASTSGRSIFGLRIEPRSPPVQVDDVDVDALGDVHRGARRRPCSTRRRGGRARASAGARSRGRLGRCGHGDQPRCRRIDRVSAQTDLADRYGAPAPWRRRRRWSPAAWSLALAFLGWLAWADLGARRPRRSTPSSSAFDVVDEHTATAVGRASGSTTDVEATCLLRALRRGPHRRRRAHLHPRPEPGPAPGADDPHRAAGDVGGAGRAAPPPGQDRPALRSPAPGRSLLDSIVSRLSRRAVRCRGARDAACRPVAVRDPRQDEVPPDDADARSAASA